MTSCMARQMAAASNTDFQDFPAYDATYGGSGWASYVDAAT